MAATAAGATPEGWTPSSWRSKPIKQQPDFPDADALESALGEVHKLPPIVSAREVLDVRAQLAEVAQGKRFLLQGGDCAERFADCSSEPIEKKLKILLQMSLILTWGARIPTLRIGRIAGQFAKPRSSPTEVVDGKEVQTYKGDNVNGYDVEDRTPDPQRIVKGYFHSATTMNYIRALLSSGFGSLHEAKHWDLGFVQDLEHRATYQDMTDRILSSLDFMRVCGVSTGSNVESAPVYISHEGLQLGYEEALTREGEGGGWFNLGAHFLWIGDRTRQLDHAHVEYFRGLQNPVGVKVGPTTPPEDLVPLIRALCPDLDTEAQRGKVVLITRLGAGKVETLLPPFIRAVQAAGLGEYVVWTCDPMHGNTYKVEDSGLKTRSFDNILAELRDTFAVHEALGSHLGGVHFELTGENVTECTGGPQALKEEHLSQAYTTFCDPRLNYSQGMEVAFLIAQRLQQEADDAASTSSKTLVTDEAAMARLRGDLSPSEQAAE